MLSKNGVQMKLSQMARGLLDPESMIFSQNKEQNGEKKKQYISTPQNTVQHKI